MNNGPETFRLYYTKKKLWSKKALQVHTKYGLNKSGLVRTRMSCGVFDTHWLMLLAFALGISLSYLYLYSRSLSLSRYKRSCFRCLKSDQ